MCYSCSVATCCACCFDTYSDTYCTIHLLTAGQCLRRPSVPTFAGSKRSTRHLSWTAIVSVAVSQRGSKCDGKRNDMRCSDPGMGLTTTVVVPYGPLWPRLLIVILDCYMVTMVIHRHTCLLHGGHGYSSHRHIDCYYTMAMLLIVTA